MKRNPKAYTPVEKRKYLINSYKTLDHVFMCVTGSLPFTRLLINHEYQLKHRKAVEFNIEMKCFDNVKCLVQTSCNVEKLAHKQLPQYTTGKGDMKDTSWPA